jgi:enamine deaminase RidA (YjgF/YER057c/UK114 family)
MQIDTRTIKTDRINEIYITAIPTPHPDTHSLVEELFTGIRTTLTTSNAQILQERVFGTENALRMARSIRETTYGPLDDGVSPAWLVVPEGINGPIAGVQIHAVKGCGIPQILEVDGTPCGRIVRTTKGAYLTLSNIRQPGAGGRNEQALAMLEKAESILSKAGIDMFAVPRTWMWLGNILLWYDDFNQIRNNFFKKRGIIAENKKSKMPASTGIGIGPDNGALCAMDLAAVIEDESSIEYIDAGGNQQSALDYGSAFSRASKAKTPAGITIFVSGTASIGADGKTLHPGDPHAQIEATINNVQAVLREFECSDDDVVQAIAYCKTPKVEKLFTSNWSNLSWPAVTAIADVCRNDLLFEIEATAAKSLADGAC